MKLSHTNNIIIKSVPWYTFFLYVCVAYGIKAQVDIEKKHYKDISNNNKKEMRHKRLDLTEK